MLFDEDGVLQKLEDERRSMHIQKVITALELKPDIIQVTLTFNVQGPS